MYSSVERITSREIFDFTYDVHALETAENNFLQNTVILQDIFKQLDTLQQRSLVADMMSDEAVYTSKLRGVAVNKENVKSSITASLALGTKPLTISPPENGLSNMLVDLYFRYQEPLSHTLLCEWHSMLYNGVKDIECIGQYRGSLYTPYKEFHKLHQQMDDFLEWYQENHSDKSAAHLPIAKAGIAVLYFITLHPFEEGNDRIARVIAQKSLAQSVNNSALLSISYKIQQDESAYKKALYTLNHSKTVTEWLQYFSNIAVDAQKYYIHKAKRLINRLVFFQKHAHHLNARQRYFVEQLFDSGLYEEEEGVNAHHYMDITNASASTATRDLQDMVKKYILLRDGNRKGTRYWIRMAEKSLLMTT